MIPEECDRKPPTVLAEQRTRPLDHPNALGTAAGRARGESHQQ